MPRQKRVKSLPKSSKNEMEFSNPTQHTGRAFQGRSGQVHHSNNRREGRHPSSRQTPNPDEVFNIPEYGLRNDFLEANDDELDDLPDPQFPYGFVADEDDYFDHMHDPIVDDLEDFEVPHVSADGPGIIGEDYVDEASIAFHDTRFALNSAFGNLQDHIHGSYDQSPNYNLGQQAANFDRRTLSTPFADHASHEPSEIAQTFTTRESSRRASGPSFAQPVRPVISQRGHSQSVQGPQSRQMTAASGTGQPPMATTQQERDHFAGQATSQRVPSRQFNSNPRMGDFSPAYLSSNQGYRHNTPPHPRQAASEMRTDQHQYPTHGRGLAPPQRVPPGRSNFTPSGATRQDTMPISGAANPGTHSASGRWGPFPTRSFPASRQSGHQSHRSRYEPYAQRRGHATLGAPGLPEPATRLPHSAYTEMPQVNPRSTAPGFLGQPISYPHNRASRSTGQPVSHPNNQPGALRQPGNYPHCQTSRAVRQSIPYAHHQALRTAEQPRSHTRHQGLGASQEPQMNNYPEVPYATYETFTENRQGPESVAAVQRSEPVDETEFFDPSFTFPFLSPDDLFEHDQPGQAGVAPLQPESLDGAEDDREPGSAGFVTADDSSQQRQQQELSKGTLAYRASPHEATAPNEEGKEFASQKSSTSGTLVFRVPSSIVDEDTTLVENSGTMLR